MTASRWFDRWDRADPRQPCTCGHTLAQHPASSFRSCSRCLFCDDYREPPIRYQLAEEAST